MIGLWFALACGVSGSPPEPTLTPTEASSPAAPLTPTAAPETAPAVAFTPTDAQSEMIRRLSMRDGAPPCADVEAGSPDAVADLSAIVQNVELPPTVPMRAAECLIAKGDAAEVELSRWMTGSKTKGLAMLLSDRIDALPVPLATRVVAAGLGGPHAEEVRARVAKSTHAELQSLAGPTP